MGLIDPHYIVQVPGSENISGNGEHEVTIRKEKKELLIVGPQLHSVSPLI